MKAYKFKVTVIATILIIANGLAMQRLQPYPRKSSMDSEEFRTFFGLETIETASIYLAIAQNNLKELNDTLIKIENKKVISSDAYTKFISIALGRKNTNQKITDYLENKKNEAPY
jgi:hypothetical protein